ncbi:MAG: preprotein translocase subunit SecE [Oscillospiraceae bacterium]
MAEKVVKKPNIFVRAGRGIARFFRDTKGEMKKVVWPSAKQVRNNLVVVLVFVLAVGLIIFALDFLFSWIISTSFSLASKVAEPASSIASSGVASSGSLSAAIGSFLLR